ncbi:nitrogen fixation negative regulator NifL [Candidatus Contendibacter odensensis]|uniref:histidine kinase n=1 Tax=Candidatus Contendobacter odensis Run_B_J11 TaxID=1400861 RepID=A0A7U7G7M5_9GAMM|nr:nitrogen fixation negative regulator NifL [Candidatus Contendobacter odensis]CDH43294.1 putative Nitrogen fixation regulatory protein [Candidatus Contendobacter odensis Run_B_J11]
MTRNKRRPSPESVLATPGDLALSAETLPSGLSARMIEELPVAICLTDQTATLIYVNPAFTAVTGYSADEVVGRKVSLLADTSTPRQVYEQMWGQLNRGHSWTGLLANRCKQGLVYLAELTVAPLQDPVTGCHYFLGIHRDVSGLHRLEQQVRNQKTLIESMVDAAPTAIALLDETGKVILDNHEYKKLVGDLRGREPATEFLRTLRENMDDSFQSDYQSGKSFHDRELSVDPGNRGLPRWFSCSGIWFREQNGSADAFFKPVRQAYLLLVIVEITNLKRQQEAVAMNGMRALLAEQERVRSMRETLDAAIFQMQAPLNLIAAAYDLLERRSPAAGGDMAALRGVLRQAVSAGREALAKLQSSLPEVPPEAPMPVNINQLLREVLELCTPRLLAGGMVVDWRPTAMLPALIGREGRLRALFKQLVDNAIDAMEDNRIKVRELRITTLRQGEEDILVTIEDSGPGIPPELRFKIFEPFFSTRGAQKRTGLGLALAQEVVNEHRGMICVDPDCDHGCRLRVLLPVKSHDGC